ncbi:MAG: ABC transporter permease [Thermoanaerobaculia bacterium]
MIELRLTLRGIRKNAGTLVLAVISLGLAIGAGTAIFNLLNAVLLRPLPVADPESLVFVYRTVEPEMFDHGPTSYPDFQHYRSHSETLQDLAAYSHEPLVVSDDRGTGRLWAGIVSSHYFDLLGVAPHRGRFFTAEDRSADAPPVAVLSHQLWERRYGGDPGVLGRTLRLNDRTPATIIGVAPPGFTGTILEYAIELWLPIRQGEERLGDRRRSWLTVLLGRLQPDATVAQAQSELRTLASGLAQTYPDSHQHHSVNVVPARLVATPSGREWSFSFYGLLLATAILMLLVACNNLAGILLARAFGRRRESAVLQAMGAERRQVMLLFWLESLAVATAAGGVGLLFALWSRRMIRGLMPFWEAPIALDLSFDPRTAGFIVLLVVFCGGVIGLAPAFSGTPRRLAGELKQGRGATSSRSAWLRRTLVVGQVPLSLALLVIAGLLVRSLQQSNAVELGFAAEEVLVVRLETRLQDFERERGQELYRQLAERIETLAGVEAVALAQGFPFGHNIGRTPLAVPGLEVAEGEEPVAFFNVVGPGYLEALGIPLQHGRFIERRDDGEAPRVAVVNRTLADELWPGQDAVGRRLKPASVPEEAYEVVGVVGDARYRGLQEEPQPLMYLSLDQFYRSNVSCLVRTLLADPQTLLPALRHEIRQLAPEVPLYDARPLTTFVYWIMWQQRMVGFFVTLFGTVAVLLAALGLYGIIAYLTRRRTAEMALRMALGARPRDVFLLVVRQGVGLTAAGLVVGLLVAAAAAHWLVRDYLFGVGPYDPLVYAVAAAILLAVAFVASSLPARRAARLSPMDGLREE